jgi:carbamoyltransferase
MNTHSPGLIDIYQDIARKLALPGWDPRGRLVEGAADLAWAVQKVTEEAVMATALFARKACNEKNLAMAGGVALNAKANMELYYSRTFDDIFVFPAANDAGSVIGAAAYVSEHAFGTKMVRKRMTTAYLGKEYDEDHVKRIVADSKWRAELVGEDVTPVAELVSDGKIVGWFKGRSELGPRALGNRSIIADSRKRQTWTEMNKLKGREWWRPLAPSLFEDELGSYFIEGRPHQFMAMMYKLIDGSQMKVPAVVHVDGTARVLFRW